MEHLTRTLARDLQGSPTLCLLGIMKCPSGKKAWIDSDMALAVARKNIACHLKNNIGPTYDGWYKEMEKWNGAEEEAITQEERLGIRLIPRSQVWGEVTWAFREAKEVEEQANITPEG
mgnify:CR=1 FL=1